MRIYKESGMKEKRRSTVFYSTGKPAMRLFILLIFGTLAILFKTDRVMAQESLPAVRDSNRIEYLPLSEVTIGGLIGKALDASEKGRLSVLPGWNNGELIKIFSPQSRSTNKKTDWYGEHAGKWLYATAMAVSRTNDPELTSLLTRTADVLVADQENDGYLGTYSTGQRLTNDSVSHRHSWDVWNLSYMVLGLLKASDVTGEEKYALAARKIGELFLSVFGDGTHDITDYGTRQGISATIILDPLVELYKHTGNQHYRQLAELVISEMNRKEGMNLVPAALHNRDMSVIGEGKAYQLIWNLKAVAELYEITGNETYLEAVEKAWTNVRNNHLSINGGPWGGIGTFYELFNRPGYWSPYGFVETCSSMAWIQFNKELFRITADARYLDEIEKTLYNAILGAQYPDGIGWCYHSFANGCRHEANFNDCCPSSGAMALEEASGLYYSRLNGGISINLFGDSKAQTVIKGENVRILQQTTFPFNGEVTVKISADKKLDFPLYIRIPGWADSATVLVNGKPVRNIGLKSGEFFELNLSWEKTNELIIRFPMKLKVHSRPDYVTAPQSRKDIYRIIWYSLSRGPLVYATDGLLEGGNREKLYPVPETDPESRFVSVNRTDEFAAPAYEIKPGNGTPLRFVPYFEAGGRRPGSWRLTWVQDEISP